MFVELSGKSDDTLRTSVVVAIQDNLEQVFLVVSDTKIDHLTTVSAWSSGIF